MNHDLLRLISDYQEHIFIAVTLMKRSGFTSPESCNQWIGYDIPQVGQLNGGIDYFKHGAGCAVRLSHINTPANFEINFGNYGKINHFLNVDFDFGEYGEIGGFFVYGLAYFPRKYIVNYGFSCEEEAAKCIKQAIKEGALIDLNGLYYLADAPLRYAKDIDAFYQFPL